MTAHGSSLGVEGLPHSPVHCLFYIIEVVTYPDILTHIFLENKNIATRSLRL